MVLAITSSIVGTIMLATAWLSLCGGLALFSCITAVPSIEEIPNVLKGNYVHLPSIERAERKRWARSINISPSYEERMTVFNRWDRLKKHEYPSETYRQLLLGATLSMPQPEGLETPLDEKLSYDYYNWVKIPFFLQKIRRNYLNKQRLTVLNKVMKVYPKGKIPHLGFFVNRKIIQSLLMSKSDNLSQRDRDVINSIKNYKITASDIKWFYNHTVNSDGTSKFSRYITFDYLIGK